MRYWIFTCRLLRCAYVLSADAALCIGHSERSEESLSTNARQGSYAKLWYGILHSADSVQNDGTAARMTEDSASRLPRRRGGLKSEGKAERAGMHNRLNIQ